MINKFLNWFNPKVYTFGLPEPTRCPPMPKVKPYRMDYKLRPILNELIIAMYDEFPYQNIAALDNIAAEVLSRYIRDKFTSEELELGIQAVLFKTIRERLIIK